LRILRLKPGLTGKVNCIASSEYFKCSIIQICDFFTMKQLIFVGGVHGVGKSTICKTICSDLHLSYLSASELIRWSEITDDPANKLVKDIPDTQGLLVKAINSYNKTDARYLLDGHFCLFNINAEITRISLKTFEMIQPSIICVITGRADEIVQSQMSRGGQIHDVNVIAEMQNSEVDHAQLVAKHLCVPFIQTTRTSTTSLVSELKTTLKL
jgi:adenylate kinase